MNARRLLPMFFALVTLLLAALPAGAQAPQSFVSLNAYQCPAGYDQIADCTKLGGVVVAVTQDGQPHGQLTSSAAEGAELEVMWGAAIALTIVGGQPAGTVLEDTSLSFDAAEGINAVTLIFVSQDEPLPPPQSALNLNAYHCPADYDRVSDCTKLADVFVDVKQDGQLLGQVITRSTEDATLDLQWGAFIELAIAGGVPERTVLEETALSFIAAEGVNAVTLIVVDQAAAAPPPPHSDTNALVVQVLLCPVEYAGDNYARDCGGQAEIEVTVSRDASEFAVREVTGTDGVVGFQGFGEGTYTVALGVPGDFADFQTVCGTPDGVEPRQVINPNTNRIGVYLGPKEELTCTFFIVPVDAKGDPAPKPIPTKPAPGEPVKALPKTGAGVAPAPAGRDALQLLLGTGILLGLTGTLTMMQRRQT